MRALQTIDEGENKIESLFRRAGPALVEFSAAATKRESASFNELIQAWQELDLIRRETPQSSDPGADACPRPIRTVIRQFMRCRFLVRTSTAFQKLSVEDRNAIAVSLFEMPRVGQ